MSEPQSPERDQRESKKSYFDKDGRWHSGIESWDRFYHGSRGGSAEWRTRPLDDGEWELLRKMDELGPAYLSPLEQRVWSALRIRAEYTVAAKVRREVRSAWLSGGGVLCAICSVVWTRELCVRTGDPHYGSILNVLIGTYVAALSVCFFRGMLRHFRQRQAT